MGRARKYQRCQHFPDGKHRWRADGVTCYCGYLRTDRQPIPRRPRKESKPVRIAVDLLARLVSVVPGTSEADAVHKAIEEYIEAHALDVL